MAQTFMLIICRCTITVGVVLEALLLETASLILEMVGSAVGIILLSVGFC